MKGHNKLGVMAAITLLVSLYFPVVAIFDQGRYYWVWPLINSETGWLFNLLIVLAILFYFRATKLYIQILVCVVLGVLFFKYYSLFSGLSQANDILGAAGAFGGKSRNPLNFLRWVQWGTFIITITACISLFIAAFKKGDSGNKKHVANDRTLFEA